MHTLWFRSKPIYQNHHALMLLDLSQMQWSHLINPFGYVSMQWLQRADRRAPLYSVSKRWRKGPNIWRSLCKGHWWLPPIATELVRKDTTYSINCTRLIITKWIPNPPITPPIKHHRRWFGFKNINFKKTNFKLSKIQNKPQQLFFLQPQHRSSSLNPIGSQIDPATTKSSAPQPPHIFGELGTKTEIDDEERPQ